MPPSRLLNMANFGESFSPVITELRLVVKNTQNFVWIERLKANFLVKAYKEGYEPVEDDFTVAENHAAQINITLYKMVK